MRQFSRRQKQFSAGFAVAIAATAIPSARTWMNSSVAPKVADEGVHLGADLSERRLTVYDSNGEVTTYGVAVGSPKYPTPPGTYTIKKIVWNPAWVPPPNAEWAKNKQAQAPGAKANPMRVVKIYFREPDYYIHGTDAPESIGEAASHGCLRMEAGDAANLARYLMDHGGSPRPESWFSRVLHFRSETQTVYLDNPIKLTISG